MAIINFTNYKRGQTRGCMGAVMRYTMQDWKTTTAEGQKLVTGIGCHPETVYADFLMTKSLHHKMDGVQFYHMVQSFPKGEKVDPLTAHAAALKLAEYYEGHEVLVCTHIDREHIHSHFLINSVNLDTGRKLHVSGPELQELRQRNDAVCMEFNLPVFQSGQKKKRVRSMSNAEYHAAAKGQSWKMQLVNIIDDCMKFARNKEEFIALMESEGYEVRWTDSRKNITYTTPDGLKCRDDRLHDERYLKEAMEHEFRIRKQLTSQKNAAGVETNESTEPAEPAEQRGAEFTDHTNRHPVSAAGGADSVDTEDGRHHPGSAYDAGVSSEPEIPHRSDSGRELHDGDAENIGADDFSAGTGWEEEREAYLQMAELASGLRPDRGDQMDRAGTAHRGSSAGDGVRYSNSGQQYPKPVSLKLIRAGLYALAATGALLDDDSGDAEERYRRIQAKQEAENIGTVIGVAAGVVMALTQDKPSAKEQQQAEEQQAEQSQQQTMGGL